MPAAIALASDARSGPSKTVIDFPISPASTRAHSGHRCAAPTTPSRGWPDSGIVGIGVSDGSPRMKATRCSPCRRPASTVSSQGNSSSSGLAEVHQTRMLTGAFVSISINPGDSASRSWKRIISMPFSPSMKQASQFE